MGKWKHGLCACCSGGRGCSYCCCSLCLWPLAFGMNAEAAGLGNGVLWLIAANFDIVSCCCARTLVRMNIREQHNIPGTCCGDCLISCCCAPCSICQETAQTGSLDNILSPLTGTRRNQREVHPVTSQPTNGSGQYIPY